MLTDAFREWLGRPSTGAVLDAALADNQRIDRQMRKVCAWCQAEIAPGTEPATHTICPSCYVREMADAELGGRHDA